MQYAYVPSQTQSQTQSQSQSQSVEEYIPMPLPLLESPPLQTITSAELDRQIAMVTGNHSMMLESTGGGAGAVSNYNKRTKHSGDNLLSKKSKP